MKREDLEKQGLNDDQINFVMAQNGKDVNPLKEQINNLTSERDGLQSQLSDRDSQLTSLKKSAKDNDELKDQIKQLQDTNKQAKQEYQDKLAAQNKSFKIEGALRDAHARNIKTVLPLIDTDKVSVNDDGTLNGLSEQLESVKKDNAYLFGQAEPPKPKVELGNHFGNESQGKSEDDLAGRIAQRFNEAKD